MIDDLPEDVQRRMMEKLLGKDNVARLSNRKDGQKFRPKPVIVTYEFYEVHDMAFYSWRIDRIENGRKESYRTHLQPDECKAEVVRLRAKGFVTKELKMGFDTRYAGRTAAKGHRDPCARKQMIDKLKDFTL